MARFETRIMTIAGHPPTFLHNISKSWEELTEIICHLHNAPRLKYPYWLALNEKCHLDGKTLAVEFCEQLAYLVRRYDRKETGYFLSNLVTALLMHHMSWVASVASPPFGGKQQENKNNEAKLFGLPTTAQCPPTVGYNALMAQYLEISGACGNMRSAKFCILGDDVEILASVCSVLSFFIRCSAVQHIDDDRMWEVPTEECFSPVNESGSPPDSVQSPVKVIASVNFEETSSVAMMRRLRNNNHSDTTPRSTETSKIHVIDRMDFPCCPTISSAEDMWESKNSEGLGRSMFAGPLDHYCPHFVLSALLKTNVDLPDVYSKMFDEVRYNNSLCHRALPSISKSTFPDTHSPESVLIVADIDQMTVKVLSSEGSDEVTSPSESVVAMLEQFVDVQEAVPATSEFLVGIIEDSLAHIVGKSLALVELVRSDQSKNPGMVQLTPDRVRTIIGCDHSDLRLIVNVAAVYWPPVLQSVFG
uniref:Folliculin n=1 Tax=Caenorhabditis japonica TaxID=281687 RepID=A0A8R1DT44_CAEJA